MRLKSNLYKDNYGNIFFSKTIQGERIVLPTHTKNPSTANKRETSGPAAEIITEDA